MELEQNKHSSKPPSGAFQWTGCPGSLAVEATMPEGPSSEFAMLGTAAHALIERCLNEGLNPIYFKNRLIEVIDSDSGEGTSILKPGAKWPKGTDRNIFEVDEDMLEATDVYMDYVLKVLYERGLTLTDNLKAERRVHSLPERDDCYGTVDTTIDDWPEMLEVVDYKNGAGVLVEVKGNKQLRLYMLGAALEDDFSHETYKYTIIQPNMPHPDGPVRSEEITADELKEFHLYMLEAAARVDIAQEAFDDNGMTDEWVEEFLDPGENGSNCLWCEGKGKPCPALTKEVERLAAIDFDDDDSTDAIDLVNDPEALSRILPWVPILDKWLKAINKAGQQYLEAGGDSALIGQKLVRGRSNRHWKDGLTDKQIVDRFVKEFKIKKKDLYTEPKLISGPKAEELLKGKAEFKKTLNDDMLFKPEGKLTMVPLSDPKMEVVVNPADDFLGEEL